MKLRMPAEWEKQEAIWLAWPHNQEDWPDKFEPIPWVYAEIVRHISKSQKVRLAFKNTLEKKRALKILERAGANLELIDSYIIPTDRVWLRDSAPTFVYSIYNGKEREKVLVDWTFNAWAKYNNWKNDNKIAGHISKHLKLSTIQPKIVLEGGSIDTNGNGILLTTEECLLSDIQCRNPGFGKNNYEEIFAHYFGISKVIWLKNGIIGDDTHGHVDDLARFVNKDTVVIASEKNKKDDNYLILKENLKILKSSGLNIIELPMPKPVVFEDQRLPASYANFLITNHTVLVPVFNDPNDREALNILAELFPKREVIGIYCGDFVWGLGTIHCASQQEPADLN